MKIGELAQATGCKAETIRYWEREGLLPEPVRTEGNYRDYTDFHLGRLRLIKACRSLDMDQGEIRILVGELDNPGEDCRVVNGALDAHIAHVGRRIEELMGLREELVRLRRSCGGDSAVEDCAILQTLQDPGVVHRRHGDSHGR